MLNGLWYTWKSPYFVYVTLRGLTTPTIVLLDNVHIVRRSSLHNKNLRDMYSLSCFMIPYLLVLCIALLHQNILHSTFHSLGARGQIVNCMSQKRTRPTEPPQSHSKESASTRIAAECSPSFAVYWGLGRNLFFLSCQVFWCGGITSGNWMYIITTRAEQQHKVCGIKYG